MQPWIELELNTSDIGDERLDERYKIILDRLSQRPSVSIPTACHGWSETLAAYRFFDNSHVEAGDLLAPHQDAVLDRIAEQEVVLLIQDTTELDLTQPEEQMAGVGPLNDESRVGFFNHVTLAVTPGKIPLGVVEADIYARDWDAFRENQKDKESKAQKRKQKPIQQKESFRWLAGYRRGSEVADQVPGTTVIVICDSEGDIFECFGEAQLQTGQRQAQWIVRACQNRNLASEPGRKLWDRVGSTQVLGTMEVSVSKNRPRSKDNRKRKQPRSARTATLTIQATGVTLKGPRRRGGKLADVTVNAVLVREINPPQGEEPVEGLLLTSLPVHTFKQVCLVIDYYSCRWQIEIYFRVLKSGCGVEELQLETADRFQPCLALYMIVAWRVMYVMMMGRECPEMSCDLILSEDEWKAVYTVVEQKTPPKTAPTIEQMVYMIASLGGYLARTHDGPPGPKTTWIGMQRMMDLALAWRTFGPAKTPNRQKNICV